MVYNNNEDIICKLPAQKLNVIGCSDDAWLLFLIYIKH